MLKNYFKIAWRNLFRHKGFAFTNLLGLTIGMTCSMLILLWVNDELSYDKFHANYDHIYQVIANRDFKNQVFTDRNMAFPLAKSLEGRYPQIRNAAVVGYPEQHLMEQGETRIKKSGYTVSEHYFDIFTWKFIKGSAANLTRDPSTVILTQSAAKAFFGDADPINRMVKFDNSWSLKVVAVLADPPGNSTLKFDFIKFFNDDDPAVKHNMTEWDNSSWNVFLNMAPGADITQLEKDINALKKEHTPNDKVSSYFAFPMNKWRLYSDFKDGKNVGGLIEYVRLFTIIALVILLIACINFMNLSTARSEKRAKEVGVRKTLGSGNAQLRLQFFLESAILALIAAILSVLIVYLLLPAFNTLVDKKLVLHPGDPVFWGGLISIVCLTGLIAGSYPAFYLSSFNPVNVLKGTFLAGRRAVLPRRILVVTQFVISILLISATIIVYRQLQYTRNRDIGYDPNNLIMLPASDIINKNYDVFKQDLLNTGMIDAVTRTSSPITQIWWRSQSPDWEGKPPGLNIIFCGMVADKDFTRTMGIKLLEGKEFSGLPGDSLGMILNKAAVDAMQLKKPIGKQLRYGPKTFTVIGVTENVVMGDPYQPVDPLMIYSMSGFHNSNFVSLRLNAGVMPQKALPALRPLYKKYDPDALFEYQFVDEEFGKKFISEELISKITDIFAGLAIFICCIGLAGLASFTIEKRIREIGIRKVLGASVRQALALIANEFVKLVLIALLIAVPLTWWAMHNWLATYTFRIDIGPWIFVAVGAIVLLLTLVVVCLNTIGAATRNPVKSLRTE